MRSLIKPKLCVVLALLLPIDPNVAQHWISRAQAQEAAKEAKKELTAEDLKKMADEMEKTFKALEAAEKEIPRDTFDPKAIVEKVGQEPDKLFEWVRDKTFWVPYQGCLRGHTGVLMDRLGSNLDRALLLAELLRLAGHKVRLAHANLTEVQAKELLPKLRPAPKNPPRTPPAFKKHLDQFIEEYAKEYHKDLDQLTEKYAKEHNLDAAEIRRNMDKASLQAAKLAEDVAQRVADQVPRILKAVGHPSEKDVQALRAKEAAAELAALRDHWWAQRQENGTWVDLDPLLPDAKPGKALVKAKETIVPDKNGKPVLQGKYCHEVIIHVMIEKWENNKVTEHAVLNHALRPSDLFGERIGLVHVPIHWPKDLDLFQEKEPSKKLKSVVLAENEWLPVLMVGAKSIVESSFTGTGAVYKYSQTPIGGGLEKGIGGFDPFGRAKPQAPSEKLKSQGQVTAEWIDYEIRVPGRPIEKIRRQIFDLLGPAARASETKSQRALDEGHRLARALVLLGGTEILPLPCIISREFALDQAAVKALSNKVPLVQLMRGRASANVVLDSLKKLTPVQGDLYSLSILRQHSGEFANDVYLNRPNILSLHSYIRVDSDGGFQFCSGFDIVSNDLAIRPTSKADPFLVLLNQGVLETNAEALLVRNRCSEVENTSEMFALSTAPSTEWLTIRKLGDGALEQLDLSADLRARVARDLEEGYAIVVPKKPVMVSGQPRAAWWRVNARTGQILGMGSNGWGQTSTEYVLMVSVGAGVVFGTLAYVFCKERQKYFDPAIKDSLCVCQGIGAAVIVGFGVATALFGWGAMLAAEQATAAGEAAAASAAIDAAEVTEVGQAARAAQVANTAAARALARKAAKSALLGGLLGAPFIGFCN